MDDETVAFAGVLPQRPITDVSTDGRLRALIHAHFAFIWRSIRRLGVPENEVDDVTQQVFLLAAKKLEHIADGKERSFLFGAALRMAANTRRAHRRRREIDIEVEPRDVSPGPDELADQHRARVLIDEILALMPLELRTVLVLFEVEAMSTSDIATLLEIPAGTVASRLRKARELFQHQVKLFERRGNRGGAR